MNIPTNYEMLSKYEFFHNLKLYLETRNNINLKNNNQNNQYLWISKQNDLDLILACNSQFLWSKKSDNIDCSSITTESSHYTKKMDDKKYCMTNQKKLKKKKPINFLAKNELFYMPKKVSVSYAKLLLGLFLANITTINAATLVENMEAIKKNGFKSVNIDLTSSQYVNTWCLGSARDAINSRCTRSDTEIGSIVAELHPVGEAIGGFIEQVLIDYVGPAWLGISDSITQLD